MFTPLVRILLIIGSIAMGIYFHKIGDSFNAIMLLICAGLFAYSYFKYGTVYTAFQALKKEDYKKAEKLISKIKNPEILSKGQKNYYHFSTGIIASHHEDWDTSYIELSKALEIGLRTKNDTSIVLLNLANVELQRKNYEKATELIAKVRTFELKPLIASETDKIENEIKTAQENL